MKNCSKNFIRSIHNIWPRWGSLWPDVAFFMKIGEKWTESGKNMFDFMKKWGYNEGKRYFVRPMAGRESAQV